MFSFPCYHLCYIFASCKANNFYAISRIDIIASIKSLSFLSVNTQMCFSLQIILPGKICDDGKTTDVWHVLVMHESNKLYVVTLAKISLYT